MSVSKIHQKLVYPKKTVSQKTGKFVVFNLGTSRASFTLDGQIQEIEPKSKLVLDGKECHSSHPHVKVVPEIEIVDEKKIKVKSGEGPPLVQG